MFKQWITRIRESKLTTYALIPVLLAVAILQYFTIEMSYSSLSEWLGIPLLAKLVGVGTVLFLDAVMLLVWKNVRVAMNLSIFVTTLLAVVNFYVAAFRGTPFTFVLIQNFTTAMNVISSYRFELKDGLIVILGATVAQLLIVNLPYRRTLVKRRYSLLGTAILMAAVYFSYLAPSPLIPHNVVGWSWRTSVNAYGYLPCLIKCAVESTTSVRELDYYDEEALREFVESYEAASQEGNTPDIIIILNETFYDLEQIMDMNTDTDPFAYIHSLENSLQGYCIAPCEGGGTNISEYELLTSNSIYLSPNSNPFNTIDISNGNSFATYLETLGYTSFAAHSEAGLNYARDAAYPSLGFDEIHFEEDFIGQEYYCGRFYETDESLYENLIRWYEELGDVPKVMYLLTVQNHANFDYLNEEEYLVHTGNDYGELTGQVNEFLTCMKLSDQAFQVLVDYFETVERDVIICMMGDHAPIFVSELVTGQYEGEERELRTRSVPFVIWSNHIDLSQVELQELVCMPYIVPKVLQIGGVELSVYYDYIVQLQEEVSLITSYGSYMDMDGNVYYLSEETPFSGLVNRYFELAYANMTKADFMMDQP